MSLDTHDEEIFNILEELQCSANQRIVEECTEQYRLTGNFVSDTVFNLSNKVLSDTEIRVLEKGLDFTPIQNKINEPELRRDFKEFCQCMRLKWHFRNEPKSSWNPPTGHPNLEVFLSQIEHELFQINVYLIPTFLRMNDRLLDHWQRIDLLILKRQRFVCSSLG